MMLTIVVCKKKLCKNVITPNRFMSNKVLLSSNNVKPSLKIRKTFPNKILEKDKENQNNMRIFLLRNKTLCHF